MPSARTGPTLLTALLLLGCSPGQLQRPGPGQHDVDPSPGVDGLLLPDLEPDLLASHTPADLAAPPDAGAPDSSGPTLVKGELQNAEPRLLTDPDVLWVATFDSPGWNSAFGSNVSWSCPQAGGVVQPPTPVDAAQAFEARIDYTNLGCSWTKGVTLRAVLDGMGLPADLDTLHLRYYLRFDNSFDFDNSDSGKVPGLAGKGAGIPSQWSSGGDHYEDSWSLRGLYIGGKGSGAVPKGKAFFKAYIYAANKSNSAGYGYSAYAYSDWPQNTKPFVLERDKSYCVEWRVQVNPTPGVADGVIEGWINGKQVLRVSGILFQKQGQRVPANGLFLSAFSGGSEHPGPMTLQVDSLVLSTSYIGPRK